MRVVPSITARAAAQASIALVARLAGPQPAPGLRYWHVLALKSLAQGFHQALSFLPTSYQVEARFTSMMLSATLVRVKVPPARAMFPASVKVVSCEEETLKKMRICPSEPPLMVSRSSVPAPPSVPIRITAMDGP